MALILDAIRFGIFCAGLGVGLTMIRNIPAFTLKYVACASFLCGFFFDYLNAGFQLQFLAGVAGGFVAASFLRAFYEKKKYSIYFGIVITSVYCVCPGVAMANFFDGILHMDFATIQAKGLRVVLVGIGLAVGILVSEYLFDMIYKKALPKEVR